MKKSNLKRSGLMTILTSYLAQRVEALGVMRADFLVINMKLWLQRQNAYSIIKLMTIVMFLYEMASSLIFALGGYTTWGKYFSGTLLVYAGFLLISLTPKGKIYFTEFYRAAIILLIISRVYTEITVAIGINIQQRYSALFVMMFSGLMFLILGWMIASEKKKYDKETKRNQ